jgi:hypothetical protein
MSKARKSTTKGASALHGATKRRKPVTQYDKYPLPFFDKKNRLTWSVKPTGDYFADCETGRSYARQFLASCDGTDGWASLLYQIVSGIVRTGPEKRWKDGGVACGGIVVGFMGEIGRALGTGVLLVRAIAVGAMRATASDKNASTRGCVIADAQGFAPDVALAQAIAHHRAAQARVNALSGHGEEGAFQEACKIERMALNAVRAAQVNDLEEAATRAVYLEKYWRALGNGDGEAENAWPYLSPAVTALSRFLP